MYNLFNVYQWGKYANTYVTYEVNDILSDQECCTHTTMMTIMTTLSDCISCTNQTNLVGTTHM